MQKYPHRLGLLAALPTDDAECCLAEIDRGRSQLRCDGFAVSTNRNGTNLGSPSLDPVWEKLNSMKAVVFCHPNAYAVSEGGRPTPLIEAPFDTCQTIVNLLYRKVFLRFPDIRFVFAHCGGTLPVLSGRLKLLGVESWVPNADSMTAEDMDKQLKSLWVDVAASAETGMGPAVQMVGPRQVVYGSDCGVPCSTHRTIEANRVSTLEIEKRLGLKVGQIGSNGWSLFPAAAERVHQWSQGGQRL